MASSHVPALPAAPGPGPGPRDRALDLLRRIIAEGGIAIGAELPSSREIGRSLKIPHATVFRALRELEEQGVVKRTVKARTGISFSQGPGWIS